MQTFVIGRDAGNQIVLNDKLVSRRHAQLTFLDNGQTTIKDLGSANGTSVNGNRITECYLNTGDIVKCGSVFLDWTQYRDSGHAPAQPMNYQQPDINPVISQEPDSIALTNQYKLSDIFSYLTTRIFEIGDLFKTNWDRVSSILTLKGVPVVLVFIVSIFLCSKYGLKLYFSPTILAVFFFAVSPFVTMYLLSLTRKVQIDKVALASGIIGFIQFCMILCSLLYIWVCYQHSHPDYGNIFLNNFQSSNIFDFFNLFTTLVFTILLVNLTIALYLFVYKCFIGMGINRSKSIYLIVIANSLDIFFKALSIYIIYSIAGKGVDHFFNL